MHTLKEDRPPLQEAEAKPVAEETVPDNSHIAFAIVFLGSVALFVAGIVWLIFR